MAYIEVNPNAVKRQDLLNLKAHLVAAKNSVDQIVREKNQMTEEQMQRLFGVAISEAAFDNTIDGIQAALNAQAVINFISQLGTSDGLAP
jgi:hypothetical protein